MPLKNTVSQYGSIAKFFHWVVALLIIVLLIVGFFMDDIGDQTTKMQVYNLHKLTGLTVLILVTLRLLWRSLNPIPELPQQTPQWERILEKLVKFGLYAAMFAMPLSGWIMSTAAGYLPHLGSFNFAAPGIPVDKALSKQFNQIHEVVGWSILVLLSLHLAGVFKHHFINKDNVLRRMMPGAKP